MKVFQNIFDQNKGALIDIDTKQADKKQLIDFMGTALPDFDRNRVYPGDIKKLINWYNVLVKNGYVDFLSSANEAAPETNKTKAGEMKK